MPEARHAMAADPRRAAAWHTPARHKDNGRPGPRGVRVIDMRPGGRHARDRGQTWLRSAMAALAVLAAAAAAVSWDAQYVLVRAVKHDTAIAALEAGIPDAGAVVFASLGVALALHARRAIRARVLNVACVGISLAMNALASAPGWRDVAIWVMPSAVYALASDTLIGVIRAWVIARERRTGQVLADDTTTTRLASTLALATSSAALVYDTANFGATSPVQGQRYRLEASPTFGSINEFRVSERNPGLLVIPPNLFHGWKNFGVDEAFIINMPSSQYEHEGPDALDLPYESPLAEAIVPFRWW